MYMCCILIVQVVLEKFHSVLLTSCGVVLTCGHGRGGRLGHGSEASFVVSGILTERGSVCVCVCVCAQSMLGRALHGIVA